MNTLDFYAATIALFLIVGEWRRDNIYRTLAGLASILATLLPDFPLPLVPVAATVLVYAVLMWFMQDSVRGGTSRKNQED